MRAPRRIRLSRRAAQASVAVLALLCTACGVEVDASPNLVSPKKVPFGLLQPSTSTTSPTGSGQYVTIYLDGPQRLVAVSRVVPPPVTVARVLLALGAGPTSQESSHGLVSPISTAVPLTLWHVRGTNVTVSVAKAFTKLAGPDQSVAVAQVVFTLTALPDVDSVSIRIDGKRAKVPTAKGTLSGGPLDRADFATLVPI